MRAFSLLKNRGISLLVTETRKRVALFGGAFDPPHFGHALALRQLLDTKRFDEVWVVPTGMRPDKQSLASPQDRLRMAELFCGSVFPQNGPVLVKSHLVDDPNAYPVTAKELAMLQGLHPDISFTVAIGPDQAGVLDTWETGEKLAERVDFFVVARDGRPAHVPKGFRARLLDPKKALWANLSSTDIRQRLKANQSISGLTTQSVIEYIEKHNLYR